MSRGGSRRKSASSAMMIVIVTIIPNAQLTSKPDAANTRNPAESIAVVVASQAQGTVLIHEKMFESRLYFVDKLVAMGAQIIVCDPHRVVVVGPSQLVGQEVSSPDIRAGMALVLAALSAEGRTLIGNIEQIDRGYQRVDEKLRALGARIERSDA